MVFFFIGVEVLFSVLFILNIRFLSVNSLNLNFVAPIGITISLATLVGAQALAVTDYFYYKFSKKSRENVAVQKTPHAWIILTAVVFVLVEILTIISFQLGAPLAERELIQRAIVICVIMYFATLLFKEKLDKFAYVGIIISFFPTLIVLLASNSSKFELKPWIIVSLILAIFLGIKRVGGRAIKNKINHYQTMSWSGSLTLIGFVITGLLFRPSIEFFQNNIIVFLSIFLIVPFITISRQMVMHLKFNTVMHESLVYLGTLIVLTTEKIIFPSNKVVLSPFCLIVSILISILAAYYMIKGALKVEKEKQTELTANKE